jgi:nitrogen fixation/metabolism regulation signal transduction histidine kinase
MRQGLINSKLAFEDKLVRIALFGSGIPLSVSILFIIFSSFSVYLKILLVFIIFVITLFAAFAIRQQVIFQLRTSTNLVEAMSSGDYSLRANNHNVSGALSDFNQLLNRLAESLAKQSLVSREKQILLTKITDQIDVAVIACDKNNNINLMNPAAEQLFKRRFDELQGWPIKSIGLQNVIAEHAKQVTEFEIAHNKRKVFVHTDSYFEEGEIHRLIFITDIQHLLRDEERLAWQKLLRVLSHEINNSLTPIASISETLTQIISGHNDQHPLNADHYDNLNQGLSVITERAHSLNHFIQDYQQLTRLPMPNKAPIDLLSFTKNITGLFESTSFVLPQNTIEVFADAEQLQQVLVNLIKNAHEANVTQSSQSEIVISWQSDKQLHKLHIDDHGGGIRNSENIFVPFYTTKKQGSGIGLTLSRQILLNHGGELTLTDLAIGDAETEQAEHRGARASISLPKPSSI